MKFTQVLSISLTLLLSTSALANSDSTSVQSKKKDNIELKTLRIHGNKELPKVLFIVPWQDPKKAQGTTSKQRLVLHSLYGDLFDPIGPTATNTKSNTTNINKE